MNDKLNNETVALCEVNFQLKEQIVDLKGKTKSETNIDKLMAADPALANEMRNMALIQKQNIILKKSN